MIKADTLAELQAEVNNFIYNKEVVNVSISVSGTGSTAFFIACVLYSKGGFL